MDLRTPARRIATRQAHQVASCCKSGQYIGYLLFLCQLHKAGIYIKTCRVAAKSRPREQSEFALFGKAQPLNK